MEPSNAKDAIRLRKKKLNNGLLSLYLDWKTQARMTPGARLI